MNSADTMGLSDFNTSGVLYWKTFFSLSRYNQGSGGDVLRKTDLVQ